MTRQLTAPLEEALFLKNKLLVIVIGQEHSKCKAPPSKPAELLSNLHSNTERLELSLDLNARAPPRLPARLFRKSIKRRLVEARAATETAPPNCWAELFQKLEFEIKRDVNTASRYTAPKEK